MCVRRDISDAAPSALPEKKNRRPALVPLAFLAVMQLYETLSSLVVAKMLEPNTFAR